MPVPATYPGVHIVEQESGSHAITGVSRFVSAFVGAARKGPGDTPVVVEDSSLVRPVPHLPSCERG